MEDKNISNISSASKDAANQGLLKFKYYLIALGIALCILLLPFLAVTGLPQ
jgi:hypothetical protein